jgi:hypothetical protein
MEVTRMYCKQVLIALTQGLDINKKKEKNVAKRSIYLRTTEKSEQNQTLISRTLSCVNKDMEIASLPLNGNLSRVVQKTKKNFAKLGPNVGTLLTPTLPNMCIQIRVARLFLTQKRGKIY